MDEGCCSSKSDRCDDDDHNEGQCAIVAIPEAGITLPDILQRLAIGPVVLGNTTTQNLNVQGGFTSNGPNTLNGTTQLTGAVTTLASVNMVGPVNMSGPLITAPNLRVPTNTVTIPVVLTSNRWITPSGGPPNIIDATANYDVSITFYRVGKFVTGVLNCSSLPTYLTTEMVRIYHAPQFDNGSWLTVTMTPTATIPSDFLPMRDGQAETAGVVYQVGNTRNTVNADWYWNARNSIRWRWTASLNQWQATITMPRPFLGANESLDYGAALINGKSYGTLGFPDYFRAAGGLWLEQYSQFSFISNAPLS